MFAVPARTGAGTIREEGPGVPEQIELQLEDVIVNAVVRFDVAPINAAAFLKALPITSRAAHCICSGECVWFKTESVPIAQPENETVYLSQGDIAIGYDHDFLIAYGRRCSTRGFAGYLKYNPIAMVRDMDAMDRFAAVAAATEFDGAKPITVRIAP